MIELNEALSKIQIGLKVPKNLNNDYGGYKYRSAEQIEEKVKPLCAKYNTVLTLSDKIVKIGERYYVKSTAWLFHLESDRSIKSTAYAREQEVKKGMSTDQITGSASSYARKYALGALFLVDDTRDSDSHDNTKEGKAVSNQSNQTEQPERKATPKQIKYLLQLAGSLEGLENLAGKKQDEILLSEVNNLIKEAQAEDSDRYAEGEKGS